ncbi:hypothetical protein ACJ41O_003755 [Fusarium nematophilum]
MKFTLITAAALVTSALAAPAADRALAVRDVDDSSVKATTRSIDLDDVINGRLKGHKVRRSKSRRAVTSADSLISVLGGAVNSAKGSCDDIDSTLLKVRLGTLSKAQGTDDCAKLVGGLRSTLDGVVSTLRGTLNLDLDDPEREEVQGLLDTLVTEVLGTSKDAVDTLGLRLNLKTNLNSLTTSLSKLLNCLLGIDSDLGPGLRETLSSLLSVQGGGSGSGSGSGSGGGLFGSGGLGSLLGGILSPLSGLCAKLKIPVGRVQ